jgi:glycosyltransferase involved in cell wall biosynthesis
MTEAATRTPAGLPPLTPEPLVSIVTPSFNTGPFIEETLRSVAEQDYPHIEHIVLDSGSTDETPSILARYPALRLVADPPHGVTAKVNRGFELARGEIVAWINADDFYLPGAVRKAVETFLDAPEVALVYCNYLDVDADSVEIARRKSRQCTAAELVDESNWVPHQTAFFRRDALAAVGFLDPRYELVQDWELWIRLAKQFPIRYVDDCWAAFRLSAGQRSDAKKYTYWREARRMTRSHGGRLWSPLVREHYGGKVRRASRMLTQRQFRTFIAKLRDFVFSKGR